LSIYRHISPGNTRAKHWCTYWYSPAYCFCENAILAVVESD